MVIITVLLMLLLLYCVWLAEKTRADTAAIAKALIDKQSDEKKVTVGQPQLGYEWHEDGWPQLPGEDENNREPLVAFPNPQPFQFFDEYSESLLVAAFKASNEGLARKAFLKSFYRTCGSYLPISLADVAVTDTEVAVRISQVLNVL